MIYDACAIRELHDLGIESGDELEHLDAPGDFELEASRRRVRRAVRVPRRRIMAGHRRRRPIRVVRRRGRPVHVARRAGPVVVTYPRYRPAYLPPVVLGARPSAILSRFLSNSAALRQHHMPQIRQIASYVTASWRRRRPIRTIRLVGHTDNSGSARCTRQMGRQRARSARRRLISEINRRWPGLARRITLIVHTAGATRPIASNRTVPGRAFNRRVAIFFSKM